jgi:hypothetical protein
MNSFDFSLYDYDDSSPIEENKSSEKVEEFDFDLYEEPEFVQDQEQEEGAFTSGVRTALQVPQGIAEMTAPGLITGAWQLLAQGEILDPDEIEQIKNISEREGVPFDEEKYMEAAQAALGTIPTVSNIASKIEEQTGLPLEAKTGLQKGVRLASSVGKAVPGTLAQKAAAATTAPLAKTGLEELGVPEPIAELGGFTVGALAGGKAPAIDVGKVKKPSGLQVKRYEKLEKPTEISKGKIEKINKNLENEFRNIASDIIEKSPIEETYTALKEDASFKQAAKEAFKEVEVVSEQLPEKFSTHDLKKELVDEVLKKKGTGFTPSEYDKNHKKFIKEFIKETPTQEIQAKDLVIQYRKNNEALKQAYEPGQSFAYNRAKRQALSDYNKSIASIIEKKFPETEFAHLFKSTNEKWSKIMDAEAIDKFMDGMFDGKVKFEKGRQFFDKEGMTVPFKRALGEEGFKNFEQLMKDLMTKEKAHSMMKAAKSKGYKDLASTGLAYVLHPNIGLAKMGLDITKGAYKSIWESLLDKPQLVFTWDKGVKAFKKGDFAQAEKAFDKVKAEFEVLSAEKNPKK